MLVLNQEPGTAGAKMLDIANCGKGDRAKKMNPLLPQIVDQESHGIWIPRLLRGSVHMESKKRIKIPPGKERKKIEILD